MKQFQQTISSLVAFVSKEGENGIRKLRKFIKSTQSNMNNSINILSYPSQSRITHGNLIKLSNINGIKKSFPDGPNPTITYYIRYYINMYNINSNKFYGNSYRSDLIEINIDDNNFIKLKNKEDFYAYVLSPDLDNDNAIVQIIFVETKEDTIINQTVEGWTIFKLNTGVSYDPTDHSPQKLSYNQSQIFLGSPRELIYKEIKTLKSIKDANLDYEVFDFHNLENIKFLLPDYVTLSHNEQLPGLLLRYLPKVPELNEDIKTKNFEDVYIKNVEIVINKDLEEKLLNFADKYRQDKYHIISNQFNTITIKERRLKCGIHNTWCFINTNGLENSLTLTKKDELLFYKGVLAIDKFFPDEKNSCALIIELNYIINIPLKETKFEDLNLPIGYSVLVPENVNDENNFQKAHLITGPGMTVYGDYLWDPLELTDRLIKINFILSKNKEPIDKTFKEQEIKDLNKDIEIMKKSLINEHNQALLSKDIENERKVKELEEKLRTMQAQMDQSRKQLKDAYGREEIPKPENPVVFKESIITVDNAQPEINQQSENLKAVKEPEPEIKETSKTTTVIKQKEIYHVISEKSNFQPNSMYGNQISEEDLKAFQEFQEFKKKNHLYDSADKSSKIMIDDYSKSKLIYEKRQEDMPKSEVANLYSKGVFSLDIEEPNENVLEFTLRKELESENLASNFSLQFLTFKPKKDTKSFDEIPNKIKFTYDFFNLSKESPVCIVNKNEESMFYNNPLILTKENNELYSNDEKEITINNKFDPSMNESIDFKVFIKYLLYKNLLITIENVENCFIFGFIKVPLKDFIRQGKPQSYQTKEYEIFDRNFESKGFIQILLKSLEINCLKEFKYDPNYLKIVNSKDGYNNLKKKKKVIAKQMNPSQFSKEEKERIGQQLLLKNKNDINDLYNQDNNLRKFRLDPEIEKKLRVMRFFNQKTDLTKKVKIEEEKLIELKAKKNSDEQFFQNLSDCEKIRDLNRKSVLSKVTQENHKNVINLTLIQGQPHYFNYVVLNTSNYEDLFHIVISQGSSTEEQTNLNPGDNTITCIYAPQEWAYVTDKEKLIVPNDYDIISNDLYFTIKPNESIPLCFKVCSYDKLNDDTSYTVWVHKKNGQPIYFLNINIIKTFPVIDHMFLYYIPENKLQFLSLVNPFKRDKNKTLNILQNILITDIGINLQLSDNTYDFNFEYTSKEEGHIHEFYIYFYLESTRSDLYMTWKVVIKSMEFKEIETVLGQKKNLLLYIDNKNYGNINVKLFSDNINNVLINENDSFTILENQTAETKLTLFCKEDKFKENIINCVNIGNRELIKDWLLRYTLTKPIIDETVEVDCKVGSITNIQYIYNNPMNKWVALNFESNDTNLLNVVDKKVGFNPNEQKYINISIPAQYAVGYGEVLVFIYDEDEVFSKTTLFKLKYN